MPSRPVGDLTLDSLASRFCYWQSADGMRYIFSQITSDDLASFSDCILLLASEQGDLPHMEWIGEIEDFASLAMTSHDKQELANLSIYVHLLAGSKEERQRVVEDLSHQPGKASCQIAA